jgi:hypothetical protein
MKLKFGLIRGPCQDAKWQSTMVVLDTRRPSQSRGLGNVKYRALWLESPSKRFLSPSMTILLSPTR